MLDEKLCENVLICNAAYRTAYSIKPFKFISDMAYGYIRKYDRIKYLAFWLKMCETVW